MPFFVISLKESAENIKFVETKAYQNYLFPHNLIMHLAYHFNQLRMFGCNWYFTSIYVFVLLEFNNICIAYFICTHWLLDLFNTHSNVYDICTWYYGFLYFFNLKQYSTRKQLKQGWVKKTVMWKLHHQHFF